jgi:peptidoglycan hydrolase-like protein with peptidoglycan-binding domain
VSRSRIARPALAAVAVAGLVAALSGAPAAGADAPVGSVFAVNPVQSSGNQKLVDDKDSPTAVPANEYKSVTLTNLDGSGYLRGDWANVVSETGNPVTAKTGYVFDRSDDGFEQVMAYYWVTQAQLYLQNLGFGAGGANGLRAVNKESQDVRINQYGADNSFSWDKKDLLRFGKGGVDDAEDAEVIVHEYGHAVHDAQVPGYGTSLDAGAIGEAFGDYLAVTVGLHVAGVNGWPVKAPEACVMDWDATSYTVTEPHCLRRLDTGLTVEQRRNQVHFDGQIWSNALWDIRKALGARTADRIIINAQFSFAPGTSFAAAANTTVATAQSMYGSGAAAAVRKAFQGRHILP